MNAYQTIKNQIVKTLEIEAPETMVKLLNVLDYVVSGEDYNSTELNNDIVFSDRDVLDSQDEIQEDTALWEEVREIQHSIVEMLSEN